MLSATIAMLQGLFHTGAAGLPGCSTTVVFAHGVGKTRVQFPAARKN